MGDLGGNTGKNRGLPDPQNHHYSSPGSVCFPATFGSHQFVLYPINFQIKRCFCSNQVTFKLTKLNESIKTKDRFKIPEE